jgi:CheY-like chemotaxis protein
MIGRIWRKVENKTTGSALPGHVGLGERTMQASQSVGHHNTSVLLVEDEILISDMVREILMESGFRVHAVATARDALSYLATDGAVDVLFTDLNLPGGMDGCVLAQRARLMRPNLPIVFASGRWNLLEPLKLMPHAIVLPKPYSPLHAVAVVERLVSAVH